MQHDSNNVIGRLWGGAAAKKRNFILCLAVVLVILLIIITNGRSPPSNNNNNKNNNNPEKIEQDCFNPDFKVGSGPIVDEFTDSGDTGCMEVLEVDKDLLSMEKKCSPDPLNFFLLWSTKREDFKLKHFRVIDSIFKYHPKARVHIFTKDMSIDDFSFYTSRSFAVVHHKLEPEKLFEDTPLARWAQNIDEWKKSSNYFSHVTDAMRLAVLWKYGGVYLDTDAIVIRNVASIRNALGVQHPTAVGKGEINGKLITKE